MTKVLTIWRDSHGLQLVHEPDQSYVYVFLRWGWCPWLCLYPRLVSRLYDWWVNAQ